MDIDIYHWRITAIGTVNSEPPSDEHRRIEIWCGDSLLKLWLDDRKASELREALDTLYPRILEPAPDRTESYADEHAGEFAEPNPNAPLPLTPADIEQLQIEHTKKALDFIYASLNRTHET